MNYKMNCEQMNCKHCKKKLYDQEYYQKNKERFKEYNQANKEKIKEYKKKYYQANKDKPTIAPKT